MIGSFRDQETQQIFEGQRSRRLPPDIQQRARRKLQQLHAASNVNDLRIPPSNHLELLSGNLRGFWSIRVNRQWRIMFQWNEGTADDVTIIDYH